MSMNLLRMLENHHGFMDMTKQSLDGYQRGLGQLDNDSLQWARSVLQAQVKVEHGNLDDSIHNPQFLWNLYSSAGHHGHSMSSAHTQNGNSSTGVPSIPNRVQDLPCTPNQNSFSPPSSLQNNQLVVPHPLKPVNKKKSYQCKMCDQMYECKSEMMLHTQQVHKQDPKPYKCPTCQKSFANSSYLSQHNRIHAGIKPYQCNFCERKFTQLSHLQQHRRTHTGEKPYKCQHPGCGKAFTQLSNLQTHSRSHMTDKPYRCNSCYKCFSDELGLREHIPKHSDTKHLKTHICRICGKSYTQETYLARHMTKHSLDGGSPRMRMPMVLNRAMKQEPGIAHDGCCTPRTPSEMNGNKNSAFIPISHYSTQQRNTLTPTQFPFPPALQNSPLNTQLPHISCVTSPGYFPSYDPMSGHRNDSLDRERELQTRDSSSMIARSLLSLQHIKSFSTTFAQCNTGSN